jgi:small subunit ribosomal protein S20
VQEGFLKKNKSAIKKARQSEKAHLRNMHVKSTMKTNIKKVLLASQGKDKDGLQQAFKEAVTCIDKAASKGVIHKNNAARRISRLSKKINQSLS